MNNQNKSKNNTNRVKNTFNTRGNSNSTLSEQVTNAFEKTKEIGGKIKNGVVNIKNNVSEKVSEKVSEVKESVSSNSRFVALSGATSMIKGFAESNTAISRFVFIILVLLLFIVLFNFGIQLIQRYIGDNPDPFIIDGMVLSNNTKIVSSNPNVEDSVPILRSVNEDYGLEFTWNVWFYVDKLNPDPLSYQRIFSKGNEDSITTGITPILTNGVNKKIVNASPGLFLTQQENSGVLATSTPTTTNKTNVNLYFVVNTFKNSESNTEYAESITIHNIPVKKWVCTTMRVQNKTVDIYINGVLTQRKTFTNLPRQNYYDTIIGDSNDGFSGFVSSLRYYGRALNYEEIQSVYGKGPNLKSIDTNMNAGVMDYLSINWYLKP
jgi:hypothetical protein